jgi:hypothetical protein
MRDKEGSSFYGERNGNRVCNFHFDISFNKESNVNYKRSWYNKIKQGEHGIRIAS